MKLTPSLQNCYVTGGSQGLGLSLAILLANKGANVTIVARNVQKLEVAVQEIDARNDLLCLKSNIDTPNRNTDKTKTRFSATIPHLSTHLQAHQQL